MPTIEETHLMGEIAATEALRITTEWKTEGRSHLDHIRTAYALCGLYATAHCLPKNSPLRKKLAKACQPIIQRIEEFARIEEKDGKLISYTATHALRTNCTLLLE